MRDISAINDGSDAILGLIAALVAIAVLVTAILILSPSGLGHLGLTIHRPVLG